MDHEPQDLAASKTLAEGDSIYRTLVDNLLEGLVILDFSGNVFTQIQLSPASSGLTNQI